MAAVAALLPLAAPNGTAASLGFEVRFRFRPTTPTGRKRALGATTWPSGGQCAVLRVGVTFPGAPTRWFLVCHHGGRGSSFCVG